MNPIQALIALSSHEKKALHGLLKGPLATLTSEAYLRQVLGEACGRSAFMALSSCEALGFTRPQLLLILEGAAESGHRQGDLSWVITGLASPSMPRRDTAVVYRSLIQEATSEVIISTYAIYNGKELFAELHERMTKDPSLKVTILCDVRRPFGDSSIDADIASRFKREFLKKQWPGEPLPEIYYYPAALALDKEHKAVLHAKCLIIDGKIAFVGSANLTEAAQERNIEVGMLVEDEDHASDLRRYFVELIESGVLVRL